MAGEISDKAVLDAALARRVLIATPVTLVSVLKGIAFGPGGTPYQFDYGILNDGASMYGSSQAKSLSYHLNQELGVNITHQNLFVRASYDVTDSINLWAQVSYANANTITHAIGPVFAGNLTRKADNACWPAAVAAQAAAMGRKGQNSSPSSTCLAEIT